MLKMTYSSFVVQLKVRVVCYDFHAKTMFGSSCWGFMFYLYSYTYNGVKNDFWISDDVHVTRCVPLVKQKLFTCPENPEKLLTCPENPEKLLTCPKNPEKLLTCPENPEKLLTRPENPEKLLTRPENPEKLLTRPENPEKLLTRPENPEKLLTRPENPEFTPGVWWVW